MAVAIWLIPCRERCCSEMVFRKSLTLSPPRKRATPPVGSTALAGVTRDSVLTLLRGELGMRVSERAITIDEVAEAHARGQLLEIFGTGTGAVISPVGKLGLRDRTLTVGDGSAGELSLRLFSELQGIQRGSRPDRHNWLRYLG